MFVHLYCALRIVFQTLSLCKYISHATLSFRHDTTRHEIVKLLEEQHSVFLPCERL